MEQLEALKKKIDSAQDLQSVVTTMKSLAAVHIRDYQRAVEALGVYNRTVELGLQIVLHNKPETVHMPSVLGNLESTGFGAVVFGSNQGMCGQFNESIAEYTIKQMNSLNIDQQERKVLTLGERVAFSLEEAGQPVDEHFSFSGTSTGMSLMMQEVLFKIEDWRLHHEIEQIVLFYNKLISGARSEPTMLFLLPLDPQWLQDLTERAWDSRTLPFYTMDWQQLLTSLIRHYFFVALYRAVAESLASENASRLSAMQAAEKGIEERLNELNAQYQRQRQNAITVELLDIVSGFEALTK